MKPQVDKSDPSRLVIFDGTCALCHASVNFIIRRDKGLKYAFSPLQSDYAQSRLRQKKVSQEVDSVILIKHDAVFIYSDAAIEIAKDLDGLWSMLRIFKILPKAFRDYVYRLVAKYRYQFFGRVDQCLLPSEAHANVVVITELNGQEKAEAEEKEDTLSNTQIKRSEHTC